MTRKHSKIKFFVRIVLVVTIIFAGVAFAENTTQDVSKATLRIITTGDLHGQVTSVNYETGMADEGVGLSKVMTLIETARAEVPVRNSFLLDAGDFLYDYETNFFYDNYPKMIQPIMKVMEAMEYDFITLGNHELDYPWAYVQKQLMTAGLYEKVLAANLFDSFTGENIFDSSMLLNREITDENGNEVHIKVGIVAATRKGISTRRGRNSDYLYAAEIYKYVSEEALELKEKGADVVIALIHGGTGIPAGSDTVANPGELLTRLSCIDAVITSHSHEKFPSNEYARYSMVNVANGLVNGKPMVATGSHASAIGVIDFELSISDGEVTIEKASAGLEKVTSTTKEHELVTDIFAEYQELLDEGFDNAEYELADGEVLSNIDCMVTDNELYQLINNAKLEFAMSYISEYAPEYIDYPIVAVTANYLDNKEDYIIIEDTITVADVASIIAESSSERDNGYMRLCKVTGKKLREWLEFCASFYYVPNTATESAIKNTLRVDNKYTVLTDPMFDAGRYFAFDGIDYEIDITKKARYSSSGYIIDNAARRITNLTYDGLPVTDNQVFVVALDSYNFHYSFMPTAADTIYSENPWKTVKDVILEYLDREAEFGKINVRVDNNWTFKNYESLQFLFGVDETSGNIDSYIRNRNWYRGYVGQIKKGSAIKKYYIGKILYQKTVPTAIVSAGIKSETGRDVPVYVRLMAGTDMTRIAAIKYIKGYASRNETELYKTAEWIKNGVFYADENGIYTICIRDASGNRYFEYIVIDNINKEILDAPQLNYISNRIRRVTGRAIPNTTVYVQVPEGQIYKTKVPESGNFSVTVPAQRAMDTLLVWVSDGQRESEKLELPVRRTGANQPKLVKANARSIFVLMRYDEEHDYYIQIGNRIYVRVGTKESYINSEYYSPDYTIIEKPAVRLVDGSHYIIVDELKEGEVVEAYCTDSFGRTSLKSSLTVRN